MKKMSPEEARQAWAEAVQRLLPFSDVATKELPLKRLLRLSLFQVSVGMALVLLNATLNRVMVVELGMPTSLVALMVALPLIFAPLRALIGHRSDYHHSAFGLRRVPYIWFGSLLQFGGFAFMPFALNLLPEESQWLHLLGMVSASAAFLLVGAGMHTTQTAGLALATDLAPDEVRPRVVALLYVTLLVGMFCSSILFGQLLADFSSERLIQVIQGVAVLTVAFNLAALWKQEAIDMNRAEAPEERPPFRESWERFAQGGRSSRLLVAVGLGTAGFTMQDILLEPYGGQVLGLSVSQTTLLTAIWAFGSLAAYGLSARFLARGGDPNRLAGAGVVLGVLAFSSVIASGALDLGWLFRVGAGLIGFGGGLFAVGTLTAAMALAEGGHSGFALGAWGAVQATATGVATLAGGSLRDLFGGIAGDWAFGAAASGPAGGYTLVYTLEVLLLLATLPAIIPLALKPLSARGTRARIGLDQMP